MMRTRMPKKRRKISRKKFHMLGKTLAAKLIPELMVSCGSSEEFRRAVHLALDYCNRSEIMTILMLPMRSLSKF